MILINNNLNWSSHYFLYLNKLSFKAEKAALKVIHTAKNNF